MVRLINERKLNRIVAGMAEPVVEAEARAHAAVGNAILAAEGHADHHKVIVEKGRAHTAGSEVNSKYDRFVTLVGPWSEYLEFGRPDMPGKDGKVVRGYEGKFIITRAFAMSQLRRGK